MNATERSMHEILFREGDVSNEILRCLRISIQMK